jgi:hypothetical protein
LEDRRKEKQKDIPYHQSIAPRNCRIKRRRGYLSASLGASVSGCRLCKGEGKDCKERAGCTRHEGVSKKRESSRESGQVKLVMGASDRVCLAVRPTPSAFWKRQPAPPVLSGEKFINSLIFAVNIIGLPPHF